MTAPHAGGVWRWFAQERSAIVVPDLRGWRKSTMAVLGKDTYLTIRPDWVREVLSPSTERFDRGEKIALYARAGTAHARLVNPLQHTLKGGG